MSAEKLLQAVEEGNVALVKQLCEEGKADINATDSNGEGVLIKACMSESYQSRQCIDILLYHGVDTAVVGEDGWTPLHYCARIGGGLVVKLVEHGAKVNALTDTGDSALHVASEYGHIICVQVLIENGCNVNATNTHGQTSLHKAASQNHVAIVAQLLQAGAIKDIQDSSKKTPLALAKSKGYRDSATILKKFSSVKSQAAVS